MECVDLCVFVAMPECTVYAYMCVCVRTPSLPVVVGDKGSPLSGAVAPLLTPPPMGGKVLPVSNHM